MRESSECRCPEQPVYFPLPTAFRLLPSAFCLCLLLSAFCFLPSAFCLLLSAYCLLPSAFCLLPSAYCLLPSAADQQRFFKSLRDQVGALVKARKSGQQVRDAIGQINAALASDAPIARYVGKGNGFAAQVEKVYTEMTGQQLPAAKKVARAAHDWHALSHGLESLA